MCTGWQDNETEIRHVQTVEAYRKAGENPGAGVQIGVIHRRSFFEQSYYKTNTNLVNAIVPDYTEGSCQAARVFRDQAFSAGAVAFLDKKDLDTALPQQVVEDALK